MAELVLAIVPLCVQALTIGSRATQRLVIAKNYMKETAEIRLLCDLRAKQFSHECKAVLRSALKESRIDIDNLVDDLDHVDWDSDELQESLSAYLGSDENLFQDLVATISRKLTDIRDGLDSYDEADERGKEGGSMFHRGSNRAKTALRKEEWSTGLNMVKTLTREVRDLRERTRNIGDSGQVNVEQNVTIPKEYLKRREDAFILHKVMVNKWTCCTAYHASHTATLRLATTDVAQQCLHVCFISKLTADTLEGRERILKAMRYCIRVGRVIPRDPDTQLLSPSSSRSAKRIKSDPFEHCSSMKSQSTEGSSTLVGSQSSAQTLVEHEFDAAPSSTKLAKDNFSCEHLEDISTSSQENRCISSLDHRGKRFDFFGSHWGEKLESTNENFAPMALQNMFDLDKDQCLSAPEQVWLASLVIKSLLRHYNTPWWPDSWTADDLSFYPDTGSEELVDSLQSLHLSAALEPNIGGDTPVCRNKLSVDMRRDMTNYGIRNLTLWCVGVLLLQIGLWRRISWKDHVQVRKRVDDLDNFSREYRELTYKLIHCDFGQGHRLKSLELQKQIYLNVDRQLDDILDKFRKEGLIESWCELQV